MALTLLLVLAGSGPAAAQTTATLVPHEWKLQSSAQVGEPGERISMPAYRPDGWYPVSLPSTVLAALVAARVYPDPMFGMNLRSIPGTTYPIGRNFSTLPMPADSPFHVPWWYRAEFRLPPGISGRHVALHLDGVTYRANVWLNGRRVADSKQVAGTYRLYEFDVTDAVRANAANVLAIEVFPPEPEDLAWTWVDWNPAPPDKNMGLWRPVSLTWSGDVVVRHPHVVSHVEMPAARADLTVTAEVRNLTARAAAVTVRGSIDTRTCTERVDLTPRETRVVRFTPDRCPALRLTDARLWWPAELGEPNLYRLEIDVQSGTAVSDRAALTFGIREVTSDLTPQGGRLFKINGRPLLIRGGGWAPDMLMRATPERQDAEMRYVRDMHLNTIRLEGKLEDEHFFDLADRYGILVLAGWCCCDRWEQWSRWTPENHAVAEASQRDQICRLRSHPSVLAWLNGSDNPPPADVEKVYVDILKELDWPNPYVSSATARRTTLTGATGVKMTGPYDWVPPAYWLLDDSRGGAHGFNTETSPGAAVPPIESLRKMLPVDHLWPIDDVWNFHAGGGQFRTIQSFADALGARYGPATGIEDFATKSQLMTYESERAMFEAYGRNKYTSTGVIQWMLNNAWPSLIWHLYDYYLRPGGGYFGAKKANEPVHVQYSYDDRSVVALNGTGRPLAGLTVAARVFNLDLAEQFSEERRVDLAADGSVRAFAIPELPARSSTYFVDLRLSSAGGQLLSSNLYWLSTKPDELDWPKSTWFTTPARALADFTALRRLPAVTVKTSTRFVRRDAEEDARVTVSNPGPGLAFFIRLQVTKGAGGEEILPVLWQDNYVSLLPGETREITATYRVLDRGATAPAVVVSGWNVSTGPPLSGR
jgi:exo-1,4-beta-D-glucosaminidase